MNIIRSHTARSKLIAIVLSIGLGMVVLLSTSVSWAATAAGTVINNQATVTYNSGGSPHFIGSNVSTHTVQELVDLTVVTVDIANVPVTPGDTRMTVTFLLLNAGNGTDSYSISNSVEVASDFTPDSMDVYFDTNGSGSFDAGDTLYVPGTNDPVLTAGSILRLFVVSDIPVGVSEGDLSEIRLTVTSKATIGPGEGDAGTEAIFGSSGGTGTDTSIYEVLSGLVMVKTATVLDPFGGSLSISGAEIRYTITVDVSGGSSLTLVEVTDAVPAYTTYVLGSLELNNTTISDGVGGGGDFNITLANGITVQWGSLAPADGTQVIRFNVNID